MPHHLAQPVQRRRDVTSRPAREPRKLLPVPAVTQLAGGRADYGADRRAPGHLAKTADSHIQHIYAKIGCSTRGAAVLFALEHHLAGGPPS